MRIIICMDLDSFYASAEELRHPELKGKPIAVCVFSGRTEDSGAVATANYMARELDIKSGMPISLAKKKDKDGKVTFLATDMDYYREVSDRIMDIMREYCDRFEQVSVDEAYLDVTDWVKGNFKKGRDLAKNIQDEILDKEGLTCSAGIGENKFIAKMASGVKKPKGITMVLPKNSKKFVWSFPLGKIHGIGPQTEQKLAKINIFSVKSLAEADIKKLVQEFGENKARLLHNKSLGIDESLVEDTKKQQLSKMGTIKENTRDVRKIMERVKELVEILDRRIEKMGVMFKTVSIIAITPELQMHTRSRTLESPSCNIQIVLKESEQLFKEFLVENPDAFLRRCGIRVSNFQEKSGKGLSKYFK